MTDPFPFLLPLAETCGLPVVPTYGSRYDVVSWGIADNRWRCRTCLAFVTDRYSHEIEHRKNSWIKEIDALYETVVILFGDNR